MFGFFVEEVFIGFVVEDVDVVVLGYIGYSFCNVFFYYSFCWVVWVVYDYYFCFFCYCFKEFVRVNVEFVFFFEWDVDYFCFGYFGIFDVVDKGWVGDYYVVVLF